MGNSLWRLQTTLNLTAENAINAGLEDDIEIIVADWGSERWLSADLHLTPVAARMTYFLQFPAEVANAAQKDSPFSEVHPLNAAARAARGEFVGRIDQDTIVGEFFFRNLPRLANDEAGFQSSARDSLFFAQRRNIPTVSVSHSPPAFRVAQRIRKQGHRFWIHTHLPSDSDLFWTSAVGIWMLPRDLWFACRGYNENFIYRNEMEVEMAARLMKKHPMINLGPFMRFSFFHLGHERVLEGDHGRKFQPRVLETPEIVGDFAANDENWGMAEHHISRIQIPAGSPSKTLMSSEIFTGGTWRTNAQVFLNLLAAGWRGCVQFIHQTTLLNLLLEGYGYAAWKQAMRNRYHPSNFKRHWRILAAKFRS